MEGTYVYEPVCAEMKYITEDRIEVEVCSVYSIHVISQVVGLLQSLMVLLYCQLFKCQEVICKNYCVPVCKAMLPVITQ